MHELGDKIVDFLEEECKGDKNITVLLAIEYATFRMYKRAELPEVVIVCTKSENSYAA